MSIQAEYSPYVNHTLSGLATQKEKFETDRQHFFQKLDELASQSFENMQVKFHDQKQQIETIKKDIQEIKENIAKLTDLMITVKDMIYFEKTYRNMKCEQEREYHKNYFTYRQPLWEETS